MSGPPARSESTIFNRQRRARSPPPKDLRGAQLRPDPVKRWTWPVYVATLRARLRCPAVLLVVCVDAATARWCAEPIALGNPESALRPLVLGPDQVPLVTDPDQAARSPELGVLSAMAHGADRNEALNALPAALASLEIDRARLHLDIVLTALPAAAQRRMEELMATGTYEYQSDFARRYYGEGRTEAVLEVLGARGIPVTEADRVRIVGCTDLDQIAVWLRRVATAESVDELFTAQA